jgi:hypothetical protein
MLVDRNARVVGLTMAMFDIRAYTLPTERGFATPAVPGYIVKRLG